MFVPMEARNDALEINPPAGGSHLHDGGSDWLWAVTALYTLSFLVFFALSFKPHNGEKIFHYLFTVALLVGSVAYFSQASDIGFSVVPTQLYRGDNTSYQVFFVKYINWVIAFPAEVIALGLMSGVSWASIAFNVGISWTWIIAYLCSAYTTTSYKWGFYGYGTAAYLLLAWQTTIPALASAKRLGITRDYLLLAGWLNTMWSLYPISFAITDGGNVIGVTQMFIYNGIIDILTLPAVGFAILWISRKWDYGKMNLHFTQYGRIPRIADAIPEKETPAPTAAGAATGEAQNDSFGSPQA